MANIVNLRERKEKFEEDLEDFSESFNSREKPQPAPQSPGKGKEEKKPKKLPRAATKDSISWSAPEFFYFEKTEIWFVVSGLIALALFVLALWTRNILFALMIILGYFSITAYAIKKPKDIAVNIGPRGIKIDNTLYPYDNLKSFWIFYEPPELKEISVLSRKKIMPHVKIPIGKQCPAGIRKILIKYLREKKQDESLIDNIARQLRF